MPWYRFRFKEKNGLENMEGVELARLMIAMFNLGGFRFKPNRNNPSIQAFIDKYPNLVEEIKEE